MMLFKGLSRRLLPGIAIHLNIHPYVEVIQDPEEPMWETGEGNSMVYWKEWTKTKWANGVRVRRGKAWAGGKAEILPSPNQTFNSNGRVLGELQPGLGRRHIILVGLGHGLNMGGKERATSGKSAQMRFMGQ